MPQVYSTTLQVDCGMGPKSMQELLMDGDTSNDIDMLNPSLTDLQIHGKAEMFREFERKRGKKYRREQSPRVMARTQATERLACLATINHSQQRL